MAIVLLCSCCSAVLKVTDPKSTEYVLSLARDEGWTPNRRGWNCPAHAAPAEMIPTSKRPKDVPIHRESLKQKT